MAWLLEGEMTMIRSRVLWTLTLICGLALAVGCGEKAPGPLVMNADEQEVWEIRLVEMRIDKNEEYKDPAQSPLMESDLPDFDGLNYYYPATDLRYHVPFEKEAGADTITLVKRKGQTVDYLRKGYVSFEHEGKAHRLAVFGPVDTAQYGDYLWLPFSDETTGVETYGGGRYLDMELDADGTVELDFNFAYNPLCDYNPERYNCTLPPDENNLTFAVKAGEKLFKLEE